MIKLKPFRQTPGLCGPASLKMVFDYYGVSVPEKKIAQVAGVSGKKGISAAGLIKAAKYFNFKIFKKEKASLNDIRRFLKEGIPVIVDWFSEDEGHYSVAVGVDKENIVLMDPEAGGIRKIPKEKFVRVWFDFPGEFIKEPKDLVLRLMLAITPY